MKRFYCGMCNEYLGEVNGELHGVNAAVVCPKCKTLNAWFTESPVYSRVEWDEEQ